MSVHAALVGAQLLLYGTAWLLATVLLKEEKRALLHWSVYSLLAGVSVWLANAPPALAPWWSLQGMLVLSLAGYAAAVRGVDVFLHTRARFDRMTVSITALGAALVVVAPDTAGGVPLRLCAFGLSMSALLLLAPLRMGAALLREFGRLGVCIAVAPSLGFGLMSLFRLVALLTAGEGVPLPTRPLLETTPKALFTLTAAALFNFSFLYLTIGRLVGQMRHSAQHDALTGLLNRRSLDLRLAQEWQDWRARRGVIYAVAVLDIDHFKAINDRHGHAAGDRVLSEMARRMRAAARAGDIVARTGGEEFLILMPNADSASSLAAAERIRLAIGAEPIEVNGAALNVTASIGVAMPQAQDADMRHAVERADAALYRAKRAGRDRVLLEAA